MTRSPMIIGAQIQPRMRPPPCSSTRKVRVVRHVGEDLWPLRPHDLDAEVGLVVQIEADSDQTPQILEAAAATITRRFPWITWMEQLS